MDSDLASGANRQCGCSNQRNDKNVNDYNHLQDNLDIFTKKLNKSRNALKTILSLVNNLYARFRLTDYYICPETQLTLC